MKDNILCFLKKLRRWIFFKNFINYIGICCSIGLLAGGALSCIACFIPWYYANYFSVAAVLTGVLVGIIISVIKKPKLKDAALICDKTGLEERTVTALEYMDDDGNFAKIQRKDAWNHLKGISIKEYFPVNFNWKKCVFFIGTLVFCIVAMVMPSKAKDEAKNMHNVAKIAERETKKIEEVKKEIESNKKISESEKQEINEIVKDITKELDEADSKEDIKKAVQRAEVKLNKMSQKSDNNTLKSELNKLADNLEKDINSESIQTQKNVLESAKALRNKINDIASKTDSKGNVNVSKSDLEEMAEALNKLNEQNSENSIDTSDVETLMNQLSNNTMTEEALNDALDSLATIEESANSLLSQLNTSNSSQNQQSASSQNQQSASSQNSNQNSNGNGQSQNSGNGQKSGAGANGQGNSGQSGNNGSGSGGKGNNGLGMNYGSKYGSESDDEDKGEYVYVPNEQGDDENLTGKKSKGQQYTTKGGNALTWAGNKASLNQVISQYQNEAEANLSNSSYPPSIQEVIKSYFDNLQ